jgi:hypothetical protein
MSRRLTFLALGALIVVLEIFPLYANDVWMHLLMGRDILQDGIPHREIYSYTAAGRPFVYHEWLSGVLLHAVHRVGGVGALILLQPASVLLLAFLLYRASRRLGAGRDLAVLLLGAGLYVASFRLFLRPHLLVLPLLAASLLLLERYRARGGLGLPLTLVAIQVLWTNLHGSFLEGVALAALFAIGEAVRRRLVRDRGGPAPPVALWKLLLLPLLLLAASVLNPYGWELVRLALVHTVDPLFRARIFEYFPAFSPAFRETRMFGLYAAWLAVMAAGLWLGRRRLDPAHLLPTAGFLALSLWMNRAIPELVIVSLPLVAAGLGRGPARPAGPPARWRPVLVSVVLLAVASLVLASGYRLDSRLVRRFGFGVDPFTPVAAVDFLEANGFLGNIFTSFPYGSYVAYRLSPRARVAFDSRTIPYGPQLYREFQQARGSLEGFRRHLSRYQVDAVLLAFKVDGTPEIHGALGTDPDWGLVHFDEDAVLYLRRSPATAALLDRERIICANPVLFDRRGIPPEQATACLQECRRLLERDPGSVLPGFLLAASLHALGRPQEALEETDRLLGAGADRVYVRRLRETIFRETGRAERAREEARAAQALEAG